MGAAGLNVARGATNAPSFRCSFRYSRRAITVPVPLSGDLASNALKSVQHRENWRRGVRQFRNKCQCFHVVEIRCSANPQPTPQVACGFGRCPALPIFLLIGSSFQNCDWMVVRPEMLLVRLIQNG
jgi:hypothetical protein